MKRVINFMGVRHVAFALTVLLTVASLGSLVVKGLNFGLDFTGGTLIELGYERPVELEQVRGQLVQAGFTDAVVQSFGATTDVLVRMPGDDPQLGERIASVLRNADGGNAVSVKRVEFVGPAVGEELRDQGGLGMLLALGGILVYVAFRFQWKFGLRRRAVAVPRRDRGPGRVLLLPDLLRPDGAGGCAGGDRLLVERHHCHLRPDPRELPHAAQG